MMVRFYAMIVMLLISSFAVALEKEDFFKSSFLDLQEDLSDAKSSGKYLMLLLEQDGCPYCAKLHKVNFKDKKIVDILKEKFDVIQLDMWGARMVTSFEGESMTEKQLTRKLGLQFSPYILIYDGDGKQVFKMPGYFKTEKFRQALNYVVEKQYKNMLFPYYAKLKSNEKSSGKPSDQPFFVENTNLQDITQNAGKKGKGIAILFEQDDCMDCAEMHKDAFSNTEIVDKLTNHYHVKKIDIHGKKSITDVNGNKTNESELAKKYNIRYTPTIVFLDDKGTEYARHESYLIAKHFSTYLTYLTTDARVRHRSFQDWLREKNSAPKK